MHRHGDGRVDAYVILNGSDKKGKFLPGAKLPIVSSAALTERGAALCLLALTIENEDKVIATFASVFPSDDPKYVLIVTLDEPVETSGKEPRRTRPADGPLKESSQASQWAAGSVVAISPPTALPRSLD